MTANGRIELAWADGDHVFNLAKIGQVLELEDKCDCGVKEVYNRIREDRWRINDIRETIRLGLIGGGMSVPDALLLTKRYVDERPWAESVQVALVILMASIVGVPGDQVGKGEADRAKTKATVASSGPQSTASAPRSASRPAKSMRSPSGSSPRASTASIKPTAPKNSPSP